MVKTHTRDGETYGPSLSGATDEILARIVGDLHGISEPWFALDVDVRNEIVSGWRRKIVAELEFYL